MSFPSLPATAQGLRVWHEPGTAAAVVLGMGLDGACRNVAAPGVPQAPLPRRRGALKNRATPVLLLPVGAGGIGMAGANFLTGQSGDAGASRAASGRTLCEPGRRARHLRAALRPIVEDHSHGAANPCVLLPFLPSPP